MSSITSHQNLNKKVRNVQWTFQWKESHKIPGCLLAFLDAGCLFSEIWSSRVEMTSRLFQPLSEHIPQNFHGTESRKMNNFLTWRSYLWFLVQVNNIPSKTLRNKNLASLCQDQFSTGQIHPKSGISAKSFECANMTLVTPMVKVQVLHPSVAMKERFGQQRPSQGRWNFNHLNWQNQSSPIYKCFLLILNWLSLKSICFNSDFL